MLKNYFITAIRNFRHHKIFTLINVLGLSVGISAALVIFLIVHYDFSFDKYEPGGDRIYRVMTDMRFSGEIMHNSGVTDPLPDAATKELTGLEASTAFYTYTPRVTIQSNGAAKPSVFKDQQGITFADPQYFTLFPFTKWLSGSPQTSLTAPFQVVITESRAKTYFPGSDPARAVGRTITYDDSVTATVTGILKDPAVITDFRFSEFVSRSTIYHSGLKESMGTNDWGSINGASQYFIKLVPGSRPAQIEDQLAQLRKKYAKDKNEHGDYMIQHLQPLNDIHFNADYDSFGDRVAHKPTLYGLILVAIFMLILGCINFINLTTAQASQRAKEIGIRKTLGSSGKQLIAQFLGETFLLTLISLLVSLALTPWLLHVFSNFIPKELHFNIVQQPEIVGFLAILLIVVTFLSGFYPAFILAGFKPIQVLKNRIASGATPRRVWLRQTLTVSQFVIAQIFIMATLIVSRQIRFSLNADLGFKKQGIVYFETPFPWGNQDKQHLIQFENQRHLLLAKIRSLPGIGMTSEGNEVPSSGNTNSMGMMYQDGKKEVHVQVQTKCGDSNYLPLYHIPLLAGRNVQASDTMHEIVINKTYANLLGFNDPRLALGKRVGKDGKFPIVGVMADFHQASMHASIKPLAFYSASNRYAVIHVALKPQTSGTSNWKTTIAQIGKAYKEVYPDEDFTARFFDEQIAKFYTAEQNIASLLRWATGLTVFISCLGLLGLVIYATNLRVKEIGVRKVLGASTTQIVSILSKDFVKLVAVAFFIAVPIAWWVSRKWLEGFAYRATIGWWIFPVSGLAMIVMAWLVMSVRTIKAANANPVSSLRAE
jgi:putative ABC transport system permease protein